MEHYDSAWRTWRKRNGENVMLGHLPIESFSTNIGPAPKGNHTSGRVFRVGRWLYRVCDAGTWYWVVLIDAEWLCIWKGYYPPTTADIESLLECSDPLTETAWSAVPGAGGIIPNSEFETSGKIDVSSTATINEYRPITPRAKCRSLLNHAISYLSTFPHDFHEGARVSKTLKKCLRFDTTFLLVDEVERLMKRRNMLYVKLPNGAYDASDLVNLAYNGDENATHCLVDILIGKKDISSINGYKYRDKSTSFSSATLSERDLHDLYWSRHDIDFSSRPTGGDIDFSAFNERSVLAEYGYTVSEEVGLSAETRRSILLEVIESGLLSRQQVISHLSMLININNNNSLMMSACSKWEADLNWLRFF